MLSKRFFDINASLIGILLLSPIVALAAMVIKLDSVGPVFYRGLRIGRWGKPFYIFKFRTMVQDADKIGGASTPDDDPRVTKVGHFLRKYKLDEIPQLINVFLGEMSLVGPRPQVPWAVERYTKEELSVLYNSPRHHGHRFSAVSG